MNVSAALKRFFALITIKADQDATSRDLRRLTTNAAVAARRGDLDAHIEGIATQEQIHREETGHWVQPSA
ncbi:hypothetical protein, partial [Klebsiella aerogenes]|uniref:hypothetical protein n=1 Tax=Klebsiella aerogenes TaxID=548 RepID=UPI00195400C2